MLQVWIFLLSQASYDGHDIGKDHLNPGQLISSVDMIVRKTKSTPSKVKTALDRLKLTGEITIETTNQRSLITIVNWASYQSCGGEIASEVASDLENGSQTDRKRIATSKKGNKGNKGKKEYIEPHLGKLGNVLLTVEELEKVKTEFPLDWGRRVDKLSTYMASTGRTYRSHYATILKWAEGDPPPQQQIFKELE